MLYEDFLRRYWLLLRYDVHKKIHQTQVAVLSNTNDCHLRDLTNTSSRDSQRHWKESTVCRGGEKENLRQSTPSSSTPLRTNCAHGDFKTFEVRDERVTKSTATQSPARVTSCHAGSGSGVRLAASGSTDEADPIEALYYKQLKLSARKKSSVDSPKGRTPPKRQRMRRRTGEHGIQNMISIRTKFLTTLLQVLPAPTTAAG